MYNLKKERKMETSWFECKVRYVKTEANGQERQVTETYLVNALSFTEAESRMIDEKRPLVRGVMTVSDVKRANYSELILSRDADAERWYKVKLYVYEADERTGEAKRTTTQMLVEASDLPGAVDKFVEATRGWAVDYEIAAVNETKVTDVLSYEGWKNGQKKA